MATLKAKYDAAQTNEDNRRHWSNADGLSAASANSAAVRQTLRNRSRYEYDNGGYCAGIVRGRADDLVGTGPTLQVLTDDDAVNEAVEQAFARWADAIGLAEKLHCMDQARNRDGEAFALLVTNPKIDDAVKLDLRLIEADLVADPQGGFGSDTQLDGATYDAYGNPVSYTILRQHPSEALGQAEADVWPAAFVLHWFRADRPGQLRGVPELTAILALFPYLRRWTLATLSAAETAASFAALIKSEASPDEVEPPEPFDALEIERNMMTMLPAGYEATQLKAEHPTKEFTPFKRELLNECGRPVRMPTNVVSGDSSQHNFSSAKLDHFGYRGGLKVDRAFANRNVLNRIYAAWAKEAQRLPGYLRLPAGVQIDIARLPKAWYWPGWPSMDKDTAGQDTERLNNCTTTLAELLAEYGQDWKAVIRQRGRELRLMEKEGVPPMTGTATTEPASSEDDDEESSGQGDKEKAEAARPRNRLNGHRNGHGPAEIDLPAFLRAAGEPSSFTITGASEGFEILAAAAGDGESKRLRKFRMTAYTGVAMRLPFFAWPVVVDLEGMNIPGQQRPILRDHDASLIVGHTESIEISQQRLKVAGVMSGVGDAAEEVRALADNGFPWQASVGASVERLEFVDRDQSVKVNGRSYSGPIYVARATTLGEVSFVPMGADPNTSAAVAAGLGATGPLAQGVSPMTFEQWLVAKGFELAALNDTQKAALQAAWKAEQTPASPPASPPATPPAPPAPPAERRPAGSRSMTETLQALRIREEHEERIEAALIRAMDDGRISAVAVEEIRAEAIADPDRWDDNRLELEFIRRERPRAPGVIVDRSTQLTNDVVEAAVCMAGGLRDLDKHFDARTLEAARKKWRNGLGLGELILTSAHRNGYRGLSLSGNLDAALRSAFMTDIRAGVSGPSTYSLPNILSNVANKFLRVGFMAIDSAWQRISATRPVNDFKQITTPSLTGSLIYKKLPPGGEIEHGDIGERVYNNQADTQARMLGIDRRDLINDDLGALTTAGQRLGRGAALRLNEMFWTVFLNNSAFFTAGNNNVTTGGTSALSLTALAEADKVFRLQTDPDGQPLGIFPAILLVPSALRVTALNLMNSTIVVATNTAQAAPNVLSPSGNVLAGAYEVVSSPYMSNGAFTGNSATAWYLLANPADLPTIEVVALNGNYMPTVETTEADFNTLGIALRGFIDVGVALQEFRAGVRAAGA